MFSKKGQVPVTGLDIVLIFGPNRVNDVVDKPMILYSSEKVFISSAVELQLEMRRCGTGYLLLFGLFLAYAFYRVLDLANEEVNFKRRLGLAGLKVGHYDVGEYFTEMPHLCLLLGLIGLFVQI